MAIRVLIVDDNAALRGAVRALLGQYDGLEVVGEADDGPAGVACALSLRPDVVLMDVDLPTQNGIDAAREISNALPTSRTLLFTGGALSDDDRRRAGAVGLLQKTIPSDELITAVRRAAGLSREPDARASRMAGLSLASGAPPQNGRHAEEALPEGAAAASQPAPHPPSRWGTAQAVSGIVVELSDLLVESSALVADLAGEAGSGSGQTTLERLPAMLQSVARAQSQLAHVLLDEAAAIEAEEPGES